MTEPSKTPEPLSTRKIFDTWWPLAFSWLLMSLELPAISAVIARLANPEINLAAYGGIVYPLALIIEAPVIMLLSASTALCSHRQAYDRIWRFMMVISAVLTGLHALVAFTPLYYFFVRSVIGVPEEIVEPARAGLMIMTPWTWSIAFRRFQQGVMIRYGYSGAVGVGTVVRLASGGAVLLIGYLVKTIPGVMIGAAAQIAGVLSEALYAGWRVSTVLDKEMKPDPEGKELAWGDFARFYIPLALTSLIFLIWQPIGSAALSRMPEALASLAVWPVLSGLTFLLRSPGNAMNEVVVALLDHPGSSPALFRFSTRLAVVNTLIYLVLAVTPLSWLYFTRISALPPNLSAIANAGFWLGLPLPLLIVFQSWFQGKILYGKKTRGVPESVAVFLITVLVVLGAGIAWGEQTGLYYMMVGFSAASFAQMIWLWRRSRPVTRSLRNRDEPSENLMAR